MYQGDVLRCPRCNKPFDKQSTLKRHGYYCRSRKEGGSTRFRSCIACVRAKARCDTKRPECSRCAAKAVQCHYQPGTRTEGATESTQHNTAADTSKQKRTVPLVYDSPSHYSPEETTNDDNTRFDTSHSRDNRDPIEQDPDWGYLDINFADFMGSEERDWNNGLSSSTLSSLIPHSAAQSNPMQGFVSSPDIPIPMYPTGSPRSLVMRDGLKAGAQRAAHLTFHTLKSYPLMLRHNTLPPFIHSQFSPSVFSNAEEIDMEPVNNCISLLHMISSGVPGSRKLFWKNVRLECERICENTPKMKKWESLAAMQAIAIYILIRLDEGETEYNNLDVLLVRTVIALCGNFQNFKKDHRAQPEKYNSGLNSRWKDWIYEESTRRICVVYQTINLLIHFEPAALCDPHTDLIFSPLPSRRQLWEAGDEFTWKAEIDRDHGDSSYFGLATNGDLVKLECSWVDSGDASLFQLPSNAKPTANWEEWCAGMDGFGGLVMLAASLLG